MSIQQKLTPPELVFRVFAGSEYVNMMLKSSLRMNSNVFIFVRARRMRVFS